MAVNSQTRRPRVPALSRAKAHPRAASHSAVLDPIITMNAGGIIQSASDSVEQVFGWKPAELFGKNVKILIPEPRRSALDRYLDRYRNADQAKTLQRTRRFAAVRKDGTNINIELSMSRADLPSHGSPYFIGIVHDVTHQIDVAGDSPSARSRLQNLITEQTRALASANLRLQLSDRMASLGTLAAGLGHDINNVLLPVRARLNAMEHAGVTPSARAHLRAVRRSIAYLQSLSDGLHFLALDPEGIGSPPEERSATDLSAWWTQMGPLLRKAVPMHVKVTVSIPAGLPLVGLSPHWLTQAVLNLIVNAGESMPHGRRSGRVRITAVMGDDGKTIKVTVSDNGRGMSHEVQRRAFDLFYTTKARGMGTGLGLPLARKVAIRAGGEVILRSERGKGTSVTLSLPVVARSTNRSKSAIKHPPRAAVSVRDHRTSALISQILAGAGVVANPENLDAPGRANIWITTPSAVALARAARWRAQSRDRSVILVGAPAQRALAGWKTVDATIIDPPDDFETLRHAVGKAIERFASPSTREEPS